MLHTARLLLPTLLPTLLATRHVLRRAYGWRWPLALARSLRTAHRLRRGTRWAVRSDAEARLVSGLAVFPALVLDARRLLGSDAERFAHDLVRAALDVQGRRIADDLAATAGAHERWHAFADRAVFQGMGAFNETECLSLDGGRFHLRVHRCLFADLARDAGVPELAQTLCDLGSAACGRLLSSHEFHRDGPARRTLAYGHDHCDYVWQERDPAATQAARAAELGGASCRSEPLRGDPGAEPITERRFA